MSSCVHKYIEQDTEKADVFQGQPKKHLGSFLLLIFCITDRSCSFRMYSSLHELNIAEKTCGWFWGGHKLNEPCSLASCWFSPAAAFDQFAELHLVTRLLTWQRCWALWYLWWKCASLLFSNWVWIVQSCYSLTEMSELLSLPVDIAVIDSLMEDKRLFFRRLVMENGKG